MKVGRVNISVDTRLKAEYLYLFDTNISESTLYLKFLNIKNQTRIKFIVSNHHINYHSNMLAVQNE